MTTAQLTDNLTDIWNSLLSEFENVKLINVVKSNQNGISYWFSIYITTKKGKTKPSTIRFAYLNNKLQFTFSDSSTKEMMYLQSEMIDKIVENIENLDPTFSMYSTFGQIEYPYVYRSKEKREAKTDRPTGTKKSDILGKKEEILSFFEELKTKELAERSYDYDERRVFQVGGTGSKHIVEFFLQLGIAKEIGKWGSYNTIRFNSEHYRSDLFEVMDQWKNFIRDVIGHNRCYVHSWYVD